jgi:outer membrane receptor protein involved in Fe transport
MNRIPTTLRILFLSALVLAAASADPAHAQSTAGSISGTVTDSSGGSVADVTVTARNVDTNFARSATTGASGAFTIPLLPVGAYEVAAEAAGFGAARMAGVVVNVGGDTTIRLVLEPAGVSAAVTVSSEAPIVETSKSAVDSVVSERMISNLPTNGRNFLDFVLTTPGVVKDNFRVGDISFAGQRGTMNSLIVDGADNNNTFFGQAAGRTGTGRAPYQFSQDTVKEFQVNSNSYSAEYGRAGGAVINVVTKSGTNDFHGGAFYFYRDDSIKEPDYFDVINNRPEAPYHYDQFGATLGGPILRDRLFFFANYDGQRNAIPNSVVFTLPPTTPNDADTVAGIARLRGLADSWERKQDQDVFLLKLDWEASSRHHVTGRYNRQDFTGVGFESGGSTVALEHSGDSLVETDTFAASWASSLTASLFNELRGQYMKDHEPGTANTTLPEATVNQSGSTVLIIGRNFFSPRETTITRYQIADTATVLFGNHALKVGFDYNQDDILNFFPGNFSGSYTFASIGSFQRGTPSGSGERYVQAFAGPGTSGPTTRPDLKEYAAFLQEEWQVTPKLTLNLGGRYDYQDVRQPDVLNPDPQLLAAGLRTDEIPVDDDNYAARLGFAWSPMKDNRTVVRGGYGLFYGRTTAILYGTAHSNNGINVQTITFTGSQVPTYPNTFASIPTGAAIPRPTIFVFDPAFENPRVQQASLGIEHALSTDIGVSVGYLYVKGDDLPRSADINIANPATVDVQVQGGGVVPVRRYSSVRPFTNFARIIQFQSSAESEYNGASLELVKRFSNNWTARLAYGVGKVTDTKPDATAVVPQGTDDQKYMQDTFDAAGENGPGDLDVRHRVVLSGVWDLNYADGIDNSFVRALASGWTIAGVVSYQTGTPWSPTVNGDLNNDGNDRNDRAPGAPRNRERLPSNLSVDPRVSKHFRFGPVDLELIAEAFNIFNRDNVIGIQTNQYRLVTVAGEPQLQPLATFRTPCAGGRGCTAQAPASAGAGPRTYQLAARVSF